MRKARGKRLREEAASWELEGLDEHLGSDNLAVLAEVVDGAVSLSAADMYLIAGDAAVAVQVGFGTALDGANNSCGHFELY